MRTHDAELAIDAKCLLGEGPVWWQGSVWWVDIEARRLHRCGPGCGGEHEGFEIGGRVGFAVPAEDGSWVVARDASVARLEPGSGGPRVVREIEPGSADTRMNDGKVDPAGRLYAGTMGVPIRDGVGTLYRFDRALRPTAVVSPVTISNGLAWDASRDAMYYIDTPTGRVDRFDWDADTGAMENRRAVYRFPEGAGSPDGMTIDRDGRLWVGLWGGWRVACVDPDLGAEVAAIPLPCPNVTSCCFGGEGLDELWITTASVGMSAEQSARHPSAGGVFVARPGPSGFETTPLAADG